MNYDFRRKQAFSNGFPTTQTKPYIVGEMGHAGGSHQNDQCQKIDGCDDVSFHNAVWATSMSGHFGTGLYWNDWQDLNVNHRANFIGLQTFFNNVDFEGNDFTPDHNKTSGNFNLSNRTIEHFYYKDHGGNKACGWIHNESVYWVNKTNTNSCISSVENTLISSCYDNVVPTTPYTIFETNNNPKVEIIDLKPAKYFDIDFYDTYTGAYIGSRNNEFSGLSGTVRFRYKLTATPNFTLNEFPDVAFKLRRNNTSFRLASDSTLSLPNDTIYLSSDSIRFNGLVEETFVPDSFTWSFGNGQYSHLPNPKIRYMSEGNYYVNLTYRDSSGRNRFVEQTIVVLDIGEASSKYQNAQQAKELTDSIYIIPNPNNGEFIIKAGENSFIEKIEVFDEVGKLVLSITNPSENKVDITSLPSGVYFARISSAQNEYHEKIIK